MKKIKIGILTESLLRRVLPNTYFAIDPWIKIPSLLSFDADYEINLIVPLLNVRIEEINKNLEWEINLSNIREIYELPPYTRYVQYLKTIIFSPLELISKIYSGIKDSEILILRGPSPATLLFVIFCLILRKKYIYFILSDLKTQPDQLHSSNILKLIFFKFIIKLLLIEEGFAAKYASLIYPYSSEIRKRIDNFNNKDKIRIIQDPHVSMSDFYYREDSFDETEIINGKKLVKILRVCWLIPSKGIEDIFHAVANFNSDEYEVSLTIVGIERKQGYKNKLIQLARYLDISQKVIFYGWVPHDKIEIVFKSHHIHILSSLAEGTPRVLIESMARGLPNIATRVPSVIENFTDKINILLIDIGNHIQMISAIKLIVSNKVLRRKIIKNGYAYAEKNTYENISKTFKDEIIEIHENLKL
jgi:glycosyltransferase involved in cell wall biosynthesis